MSLPAIVWVMKRSTAELGPRLVLLVLAEHAHDDGTYAFPSVETMMERSRLSRRSVQMALRKLEAEGHITSTGKHPSGTMIYSVLMVEEGGADIAPPAEEGGADSAPGGAQISTRGGADIAPEPSRNQEQDPPGPPIVPPPKTVARRSVSSGEAQLSTLILAEWNRQAGQSLTGSDWHIPIIGRIREHPELGVEEHAHVIAVALSEPWWSGPTNPSVVYGNGRQFDRCLLRVTHGSNGSAPPPRRYGRGITAAEALAKIASGEIDEAVRRINRT